MALRELPQLKIRKVGEAEFVVQHCAWARSVSSRFWGLMAQKTLAASEGLLLEPCNQVHMFFMRFGLDVLFLDKGGQIVAVESLQPWRVSRLHFRARKVLELPYGSAEKWGWRRGDHLEIVHERGGA